MLKDKIEVAFNKQLNAELYSAYLYLSMASFYQSINLPGFANWMRVQEQEERGHALMFYDYIISRGGRVKLQQIDAPPIAWPSPLTAFEEVVKHEEKVTGLINDLVSLAIEQRDHAANAFLQWFVTEQVEEEESARVVVDTLKRGGDNASVLFMLDRELAQRVYVPATATTTSTTTGAGA